jgi:hypothetical protein
MFENKFTKWSKWESRESLFEIDFPGVYCIAISERDFSEQNFDWVEEIECVGMTNKQKLKKRLQQFDDTINKDFKQFDNPINERYRHGGADRVLYVHRNYQKLVSNLYVSVSPFTCEIKSYKPEDLRIRGDIAKYEYECIAIYAEKFDNKLPKFNDPRAPKCKKLYKKLKREQKNILN